MTSSALANVLRIGIAGVCLLLAFVGFLQAYPAPSGVRSFQDYAELFYKAIQLLLGQFPADLAHKRLPLALQISRFALPISAAWATISIGWIQVRNRARAVLIRLRGDHLIVAGEGLLAEGLVRGERLRKGRVLAWVENRGGRVAREAEERGGAYVDGAEYPGDLSGLGIETARIFVAACESDATNMDLAKRVLDYATEKRKAGDPLRIVARVDDLDLQTALEARLSRREQRERVELRLAAVPQLLARQFLLNNPMDRRPSKPDEPVRLCLIGWSALTEMLLVRVLASIHFVHSTRLELVIADTNIGRAEAVFRSRRPSADQIGSISFVEIDVDTPAHISAWLVKQNTTGPFNAVCVTNNTSSDALSIGMAIETEFERHGLIMPPLYVYLPETITDVRSLVDDSVLKPFGSLQSLSDPEALLQEKHDEIARSIHDFYLAGRLAEGMALGDRPTLAEWDDLPEAVRDENRLVADCYFFKLHDIGASIIEGAGPQLRFTPDEVERLAEAEHRRWMAAKLLTGWAHAAVRDDAAKLHPDLVSFSALSPEIKELDREQIRVIPRIVGQVGRRAIRNLVVGFAPESADPPDAATVQTALERVAVLFPDRRFIVRADLSNLNERLLALHAFANGYPVDVVLRQPLSAILRQASASDRPRLADLVRDAYALHACPTSAEAPPPPDVVIDMAGRVQTSTAIVAEAVASN